MRKHMLGGAAALALLAFVPAAQGASYPIPCKVPNVVGKKVNAASSAITSAGCSVGKVTTKTSNTVPADTVISQSPSGGTSKPAKAPVSLTVSSGKAPPPGTKCTVPNVVGKNEADAVKAIVKAKCSVGSTTNKPSTKKAGTVLAQSPSAGKKVNAETKVNLTVSSSKAPPPKGNCTVPNVVGKKAAAADSAITKAKCAVGSTTNKLSTKPAGTVLAQSPSAGKKVKAGTKVNLTVASSKAPPPKGNCTVPNVVGKKVAAADSAITKAKCAVGSTTQKVSTKPAGTVLAQSPAAGKKVKAGTKVKLTVASSKTPPPKGNCTVPNVVGKTSAAASSALTAAKCAVGAITQKASTKPAGTVLSQSPAAGKKVKAGTKVKLTVAKGKTPPPGGTCTVPKVVGKTQAAATTALTAAKCAVGAITTTKSKQKAGTVLSSSPAAGAKVKAGTKVKLTVSAGTAPPPGANCTVPNVVGKTSAAASSALTAAKCAVGAITQKASTKPAGTVLSQSPAAGAKVKAGTKVKLTVAKGKTPPGAMCTVPNVVGKTTAAASSALTAAKCAVGAITKVASKKPAGTVLSSSPVAGKKVNAGTKVKLTVSK